MIDNKRTKSSQKKKSSVADILVTIFLKYSQLLPINNPLGPTEVGLSSESQN